MPKVQPEVQAVEDITVELKPHIGEVRTAIGVIKTRIPQDVVFVNGVWAGYVGTEPGSQINIILTGLPKEVMDVVKAKVDAIRNNESSSIAQARPLHDSNVVVVPDLDAPSAKNSLADEEI